MTTHYGPEVPDSEIPIRRIVTPLHARIEKRKARKFGELYTPPLPLPLLARARAAHPDGPAALLVIGLHYKLAIRQSAAKLTIRKDILDRLLFFKSLIPYR